MPSPPFDSRLICGDILQVLSEHLAHHKFDVIIADPPYNIGKDFGNDSDKMPLSDYIDWSHKWLAGCLELLTDEGVIYVYGFHEVLARIAAHYPIEGQRWLAWHYTNKTVPSSTFWQRSHEAILCLWKPGRARPSLEVDQIREPYTDSFVNNAAGKMRKGTESRYGGDKGRETIYTMHKNGALPRDVIKVPALAGGAGAVERWFMCHDCGNAVYPPAKLKEHRRHNTFKHLTQKPMELTKRLIRSRINGEGGRTLIPFAGSGSECVVAKTLNIEWLGIEINPQYVDFANKWLACV